METYLAFAVGPEICNHANNVVKTGVRALVYQEGDECADGIDNKTGFDRSMETATSKQANGPFPRQTQHAHEEVDDLQSGNRLDGAVEVLGQEVPEDLGPEEGFNGSAYLVCGRVSQRVDTKNRFQNGDTHKQRQSG